MRQGLRDPLPEKRVKFNDGAILSTDPWRIVHLELLAIAEEREAVLENPRPVIRVALEYANGGFPWLLEQLVGEAEPTLRLMNRMDEVLLGG